MVKNNKKLTIVLIIYSVIFYAVWALYELFIAPDLKRALGSDVFNVIDSAGIKPLLWTLPALLLVKKHNGEVSIPIREMFSLKRGWKTMLTVMVPMTAFLVLTSWRANGKLGISGSIPLNVLIYLFVGFTEESVFRGWLFNAAVDEEKPWPAYAMNAMMFLLIHFPKWIADGKFGVNMLSGGFIFIMMLSVLFCWTFRKTRNLLVPAFLHFWWDVLATLLE